MKNILLALSLVVAAPIFANTKAEVETTIRQSEEEANKVLASAENTSTVNETLHV